MPFFNNFMQFSSAKEIHYASITEKAIIKMLKKGKL
jgi:hypothetical protein